MRIEIHEKSVEDLKEENEIKRHEITRKGFQKEIPSVSFRRQILNQTQRSLNDKNCRFT